MSAPADTAFAAPDLPTPLAVVVPADPGARPGPGDAEVRLRLHDDPGVDDGDVGDPGDDDVSRPSDAPTGWRPRAGGVGALTPVDDAPRWLVGAGAGAAKDWRAAGAAAVRAALDARAEAVLVRPDRDDASDGRPPGDPPPGDRRGSPDTERQRSHTADVPADADGWASLVTGLVLGSHRYSLRTGERAPAAPPRVLLSVPAEHRDTVARAAVLARATAVARDLADTPSGAKSPDWFARTAVDLLGDAVTAGLSVEIRDERWLAEHGFGGTLAVGGGSARPPRLLELAWSPAGASEHVVLVGKGITFDTGGISIKPNAGMADMRTDCSGGAAVVAALGAVAALDLPVRVSALVPIAENHVSGSSYRPGDVVRHRDGTTTEVTNTDAEGRMVLADAIGHAVAELDPDVIVDVATLTGAMKVALGVRTGGLFATSDALAARLVDAGAATGEAWWRMPLSAHLVDDVTSTIADVRQAPAGPGAIMAALFLHRFTGGRSWAHLDIAGPARSEGQHEEVARGATGFAARTLIEFCAASRAQAM